MQSTTALRPYRIDVSQHLLSDLRTRLERTRFADQPDSVGPEYGVTVDRVGRLVDRWLNNFEWRDVEKRLNDHPQFTTDIDGHSIHFFRIGDGTSFPLLLTHGWPGTAIEFVDAIDELSPDFDLVIPSIPGFGFSGPTSEAGWDRVRVARAWVELMDRLGYRRYGVVGNDAGSLISPEVGRLDPDRVAGVHVTQVFSFPTGDPAEMEDLDADDLAALEHLQRFWETMGAFNVVQSQAPQTLAHALSDSPAGLLGWMLQLLDGVDDDFVLANVSAHWLFGTAASSIRFYREDAATPPAETPTTVPLGLARFGDDFKSVRRFSERDHSKIVRWETYEEGGHYAPHQVPATWAADVKAFFVELA